MVLIIDEEAVRTIRKAYAVMTIGDGRGRGLSAVNVIELSKRYGVSQETIRRIAHYKSYAWVPDVE